MSKNGNRGAFVAGSVIGGVIGAVITLWTTPKSGAELRSSISPDTGRTNVSHNAVGNHSENGSRFSNPVLGFIERAAAPLVGVELGKQARDDPAAVSATPIRRSSADARPPSAAQRATAETPSTSVAKERDDETHQIAGSDDDEPQAASTDELTTPPEDYVERLNKTVRADKAQEPIDFPDLPSKDQR